LAFLGGVLAGAGSLLVRHWPVLMALSFAGWAARTWLMLAAVRVSRIDGVLGYLVVVLVPITTLVALILMLRAVRVSLPAVRAVAEAGGRTGVRALLDHLGSVLVPFLVVYAYSGYLKEDVSEYVYGVAAQVAFAENDPTDPRPVDVASRLPFQITVALLAVVAVAALLRFGLGRWKGAARRPWLGIVGAYLEIIWITLAAAFLFNEFNRWLTSRRLVNWLEDAAVRVLDQLGPLSANAVLDWLYRFAADAVAVIAVPVAWLAVGAVVYGRTLAPSPVPADLSAVRAWRGLPATLQGLLRTLGAGVRERFGPMMLALGLLLRARVHPILLVFLVVQSTPVWLWEIERLLIGPRDLIDVWIPLSRPLGVINDAIRATLLVCLLAATVEHVLRTTTVTGEAAARTSEGASPH
jgi:hypothetical protein